MAYGFCYSSSGHRENNGAFSYNRAVKNPGSLSILDDYDDQTVTADTDRLGASFNGGARGVQARATKRKGALAAAHHGGATIAQVKHFELAAMDRSLYSKPSNPKPAVATSQASVLEGASITHNSATGPFR